MEGENQLAPLIYRFDVKNKKCVPQKSVGHHICTNGPTWSIDGTKFYFTCSTYGEIREYDYDLSTSTIKGPARTVLKMGPEIAEKAIFDGGCIDSSSMLWWACNGGQKIVRINPIKGCIDMQLKLEFVSPTSVAFGGPDYKTLIVTSMGTALPGTDKPPIGGVALIRFKDESISGLPPARCNEI